MMLRTLGAVALLLVFDAAASAQTNLRAELAKVAQDVKKVLDGRNEDSILLGQFAGPAHLSTSAGPAIAQVLAEELKNVGIAVKQRANLAIEGRYRDVVDSDSKSLAAELKFKILDRQENIILEGTRGIFGDGTLPALFGATVQYPPGGTAKERSQAIEKALDNPALHLNGARVSAAPGSPYSIEILVKKSGGEAQPRTPESKEGLAFIPIARGEIYEVRLHNDSPHEAAVGLSIDGLGMFSFSELRNPKTREPKYSFVLIPSKKSIVVKGWHRDNKISDEFLVTDYAKSAAAELKSSANVGTVTANFSAAWPVRTPPPADEPTAPSKFARLDATGRGSKIEAKYEEVEREIGVVRACVSIRYSK